MRVGSCLQCLEDATSLARLRSQDNGSGTNSLCGGRHLPHDAEAVPREESVGSCCSATPLSAYLCHCGTCFASLWEIAGVTRKCEGICATKLSHLPVKSMCDGVQRRFSSSSKTPHWWGSVHNINATLPADRCALIIKWDASELIFLPLFALFQILSKFSVPHFSFFRTCPIHPVPELAVIQAPVPTPC
jgi:hypothetical protein